MTTARFEAREGDILVVSYPEVTVPIAQYFSVKCGGLIYTRKLVAGEDPEQQYEQIYEFLQRKATADGRAKVKEYRLELARIRGES